MKSDAELSQYLDMSDEAMRRRAKALRIAVGLTQQELADRLGVSVSAVKSWEAKTARNTIRASHIGSLATYCDVKTDFIILGDVRDSVIAPSLWAAVKKVIVSKLATGL